MICLYTRNIRSCPSIRTLTVKLVGTTALKYLLRRIESEVETDALRKLRDSGRLSARSEIMNILGKPMNWN
jgi:hypothetical protein